MCLTWPRTFIYHGAFPGGMNDLIPIHSRCIQSRKQGIQQWAIASEDKVALRRFLAELELGKVNRGRRISSSRQCKYLDVLRAPLEFFRTPVRRLTLRHIERFEKALAEGTLRNRRDRPYLPATRIDMRQALKIFLRWRLGVARAAKLTGWLDTRRMLRTPDFLRETDIEKLLKACKSARERYLVAVLFDAGARATEFHNIRMEDIQLPQGPNAFVRLTLKQEYSKTKGRTISLYWKHSLEAVRDFIRQREIEGLRAQDPVFVTSYPATRKFLLRLGRRVLGRSIHYHLFRHSSATYYADKMNRQQLCIRYGWTFSSNMPDIYIARAGVETPELDERFKGTEVETLKQALSQIQQQSQLKTDRIVELEQTVAGLQQNFSALAEVLALNPSVPELQAAIRRKKSASGPS